MITAVKHNPTIGIECHVQLNTKTKLFAAVGNDARQALPNTLISHICVGMPGALPVLNEAAVELAIKAAFALNTKPQRFSKFDRKHYFYPDLPKGYQITQYEEPIISGGYVDIEVSGNKLRIGIARVHLEEDAGKNTHPSGADHTLVDLNRAGTPLLEIVSQPDIHSAAEAKAFAKELWLLMRYAGVTDGDLYHGHVRFDVNVSVSDDPSKPGTRTEVKNLNSFRSVENAVDFEIKRQTELIRKGGSVTQETRGWDEAKQKTVGQRGKEEAHDYRYFPEPDIPPLNLNQDFIDRIAAGMPDLPARIRGKLAKLELSRATVDDLLARPHLLKRIVDLQDGGEAEAAKREVFWSLQGPNATEDGDILTEQQPDSTDLARIVELSKMVDDGQLNSNAAKKVRSELRGADRSPLEIAKELNLLQVSDEAEIKKIVSEVLAENTRAADDVKNGETKAIAFLVGQVMKKSQGKANPSLAQDTIKNLLGL